MNAQPNKGKPRPLTTFGGRLRAERERLGLNQRDFAALAGNSKEAQVTYEAERRSPDARAMMAWAAQGVDVLFVLTGRRAPDEVAPADHDALWAGIEAEAARLRDALAAFQALLAGALRGRPKDREDAGERHAPDGGSVALRPDHRGASDPQGNADGVAHSGPPVPLPDHPATRATTEPTAEARG